MYTPPSSPPTRSPASPGGSQRSLRSTTRWSFRSAEGARPTRRHSNWRGRITLRVVAAAGTSCWQREGAYHEPRARSTLSDRSSLRADYEPWLGQTVRVPMVNPYRDDRTGAEHAAELDRIIRDTGADRIAAFVAEPISGATLGAVGPPDDYWPAVAETISHARIAARFPTYDNVSLAWSSSLITMDLLISCPSSCRTSSLRTAAGPVPFPQTVSAASSVHPPTKMDSLRREFVQREIAGCNPSQSQRARFGDVRARYGCLL